MNVPLMRCPRIPGITSVDDRGEAETPSFSFEGIETVQLLETMPRMGEGLFEHSCLRGGKTFGSVVEQGTLDEISGKPGTPRAQVADQMLFALS